MFSRMRRLVWSAVVCLVPLSALSSSGQAQQRQDVALELVLAIDTSTSVDADEFTLQKRGLSNAFRHPRIIAAIEGLGALGVAASVVQWSSNGKHLTAVDWVQLKDAKSAGHFAAAIDAMPRLLTGFTGIAGAIRYSVQKIEENSFEGRRKVIDVSGDGASSSSGTGAERDRAVALGITINGLAILTSDPDFMEFGLKEYYAKQVIGGDGAFLLTADGFEDFITQMRKKLEREIIGPGLAALPVGRVGKRPL